MNDDTMLEVAVKGLTFDPITNVPIVLLKDVNGKRLLPIWIGVFEANAIALEMENVSTPRPMTHDLLNNFFSVVESRMRRVVVDNLLDNTFYATIYFDCRGEELKLDSRPSDAIALALRARTPIFVTQEVMSQAQSFEMEKDIGDKEDWKKWLERITPEDFSRYKS
jgi:bifunctional DNase/RNase